MISPWNFPALLSTFKIAPMLASGCTGIMKPPENAPLSTIRMVQLWNEVEGVVPGVLNCLPGLGSVTGEALTGHEGVQKVSFTGSTAIGKRIMSRASSNMKRLNLELGGKGPLILFEDGDIDKAAAKTAQYGLWNSGQFCGAPSRIIVQDKVYDEFVEKLAKIYTSQVQGGWREEGVTLGPVIS